MSAQMAISWKPLEIIELNGRASASVDTLLSSLGSPLCFGVVQRTHSDQLFINDLNAIDGGNVTKLNTELRDLDEAIPGQMHIRCMIWQGKPVYVVIYRISDMEPGALFDAFIILSQQQCRTAQLFNAQKPLKPFMKALVSDLTDCDVIDKGACDSRWQRQDLLSAMVN